MIVKETKKYRIEREDGLIDDCKYMLYFADGWSIYGGNTCMPCKSIKEAMEYVKEADWDKDYESIKEVAKDVTKWKVGRGDELGVGD